MREKDTHAMSFLEHLEVLRWHLIRCVVVLLIVTIALFFLKKFLFHHIILAPGRPDFWTYEQLCRLSVITHIKAVCIDDLPFIIQSRRMAGQFSMHIIASLVAGGIVAFPYLFWELWRFVKPGLKKTEKGAIKGVVLWVSLLFLCGVLFGYFILLPISIHFLANYQIDASIQNEFDITSYVSTVTLLVLSSGIVFLLPMLVYFLKKSALISLRDLVLFRKYAVVLMFVVSAMITPPDPFSQLLLVVPLLLLYEVGIAVARYTK